MELKKALATALDFEKKGHDIYLEASKKAKNPIVKKTFDYLAGQEMFHINDIEAFASKNNPGLKGNTIKKTEKFFTTTTKKFKKKTSISSDELKLYKTAIGLEQASHDFYKAQLDASKDPKAKKFFSFLMAQENSHYELLRKSQDFIKDPSQFFLGEENWAFEG